jgi:hypothetical protein
LYIQQDTMIKKVFTRVALPVLVLLLGMVVATDAQDGILVRDTVETIVRARAPVPGTSGPVEQSYILIEVAKPRALLVLFAGGGGQLHLADGQLDITSTNFLVRSRHLFAASQRGFNVVVPDAASDILTLGTGLRGLRGSQAHLSDIAAMIEDVKNKVAGGADLPVCLIGTSRGTISASAYAATAQTLVPGAPAIDCLVLTASVTEPSGSPNESLDDVPLGDVTVPTLLAAHWRDKCFVTPPQALTELKAALIGTPRVTIRVFIGGTTPLSDPCGSLSPHGFFGIEPWVVKAIGNWTTHQLP